MRSPRFPGELFLPQGSHPTTMGHHPHPLTGLQDRQYRIQVYYLPSHQEVSDQVWARYTS
jgi:hypothetical protein